MQSSKGLTLRGPGSKAFIDLTGPLLPGLDFYGPPSVPVELEPIATLDREGYSAHRIQLCTLSGTYLETSAHRYPNRRTIDQVAPHECFLTAMVAHVPRGPRQPVGAGELATAFGGPPAPGLALLVDTGWSCHWNSPRFNADSPFFTMAAMEWLLSHRPALIGGDMPAFDSVERPAGVVQRMMANDVLLLAPLVGLGRIDRPTFQLVVLPLPLPGASASPCRAVAVLEASPQAAPPP